MVIGFHDDKRRVVCWMYFVTIIEEDKTISN